MRIAALLALAGCTFEATTTPKDSGTDTDTGVPVSPPPTTTPPTATRVEDRIAQLPALRIDVLWVLDGSGATDLGGLANAPLFFDFLLGSGIDYHVGVVSADLDDPLEDGILHEAAGLRWVDADTPDPIGAFTALAAVSPGSAAVESMGAVYRALDAHAALENAGFLRADSDVHVIVASDGRDDTDPAVITALDFEAWFGGLNPYNARTYSCLSPGPAASSTCGDTAASWSGVVGDLTDLGSYEALGLAASGLTRVFALTAHPVVDSLVVEVEDGGATLAFDPVDPATGLGDYVYDEATNSIAFAEYVPSAYATVVARYVVAPP